MKQSIELLKLLKFLPVSTSHQTMEALYPTYYEKHSHFIQTHIDKILQPIQTFFGSMNALQKSNDNVAMILKSKLPEIQQRCHENWNFTQMNLTRGCKSVLDLLYQQVKQQKNQLFGPFASSFPFIQPIQELLISEQNEQSSLECDVQYSNPYQSFITNCDFESAYNMVTEIPRVDKLVQDIRLDMDLESVLNRHSKNEIVHAIRQIMDGEMKHQLINYLKHKFPITLVNDKTQLEELIIMLDQESIFAIDLQESTESYFGRCCLLSISLFDGQIFLIDCLQLSSEMYKLRSLLLDPQKLKILVNSENTSLALQRDFRLYLNCIFDVSIIQDLQIQVKNCFNLEFGEIKSKSYHRPISNQQMEYYQVRALFLIELMQIQRQSINVHQYTNELKEILSIGYGDILIQKQNEVFHALKQSKCEIDVIIAIFTLFCDCVQRFINEKHDIPIDTLLKLCGNTQTCIPHWLEVQKLQIPSVLEIAKNYFKHLQNEGQFNISLNTALKSNKASFNSVLDINWKNICDMFGWQNYDDDESLSIASATSHFSRSNVEKLSMKEKKKDIQFSNHISLQQTLLKFVK